MALKLDWCATESLLEKLINGKYTRAPGNFEPQISTRARIFCAVSSGLKLARSLKPAAKMTRWTTGKGRVSFLSTIPACNKSIPGNTSI